MLLPTCYSLAVLKLKLDSSTQDSGLKPNQVSHRMSTAAETMGSARCRLCPIYHCFAVRQRTFV
jgi:hypothetical protein